MRPSLAVALLTLVCLPATLPAQKVIAFPTLPAPVLASRPDWMPAQRVTAVDSIKVGDYRTEGAFFFGFIGAAVGAALSSRDGGCNGGPVLLDSPSSGAPRAPAAPTTVCEVDLGSFHNVVFGAALGATIGYLIGRGRPKWREGNPDQ